MKTFYFSLLVGFTLFCCQSPQPSSENQNPFLTSLNEPIEYGRVTASDVAEYADYVSKEVLALTEEIKSAENNFDAVVFPNDNLINTLNKCMNNCYMLYWVSPDSATRATGLASYQTLDSLYNQLNSDRVTYEKFLSLKATEAFGTLTTSRQKYVNDIVESFERSGVGLEPQKLERFKQLNSEITDLTSQYSINMNTANLSLKVEEDDLEGVPVNFKDTYRAGEIEYEIPVMPATRGPILNNAEKSSTRREYYFLYNTRAVDENMNILDQLIQKRYEIGTLMGHPSYASYNLAGKMAGNSETVWNFLNGLIEASRVKAVDDLNKLKQYRKEVDDTPMDMDLNPWDVGYYRNQLLKSAYDVDYEKIREYLPMEACLSGMMEIYQELLGYTFKKVEDASVWHEEVEMYEVYDGNTLRGRFYLDLFPRPNKESWFYGVGLTPGKAAQEGYEVPVKMLLGNFTRPTEKLPSLLSFNELSTLFHEFGHIMDGVSYRGEFAGQSFSESDFAEAMSQIFENWIWNYDILSRFAKHYETGEVLPKETFDRMLEAKNITSGLSAIGGLRRAAYDMTIYDKYDPENPLATDEVWRDLDAQINVSNSFVEGTHPQASWIHINTHPVYYYGYIWSDVYAQDMFTEFQKNGLLDQETGKRYRDIILANGSQKPVDESVEEFLGRPMNNSAYVKSLGLK